MILIDRKPTFSPLHVAAATCHTVDAKLIPPVAL